MTSKRRKVVIVLACAVLAITLALWLARDREPSYQGKPLREWVVIYKAQADDDRSRQSATHAIRAIGTNALPFLLEWLRYKGPSKIEIVAKSVAARLPDAITPQFVEDWVTDNDGEVLARNVPEAFGALGAEARFAIPELTKLMDDPAQSEVSFRAVYALGCIGMEAWPLLSARLAGTNASCRRDIADTLGLAPGLRTNGAETVPQLLRCLNDHDERLSENAAWALGFLAQEDSPQTALIIPALTNCLNADHRLSVCQAAIWALGCYGNQAREAVPILLQAAAESDERIRSRATNALMKIAPEALTNAPPR